MEIRLSEQVAEQVRRELGARQMPAAALAPVLGCGPQAAQRKARGDVAFDLDEVLALAAFFGVPFRTLVPAMDAAA